MTTTITQEDGTQFTSKILAPGWTEFQEKNVSLATGVYGQNGEWYLITGDTLNGLTQNPAVANAIVSGIVEGMAKAAASGLFGPR